jgi:nitrite reductase/ring-hydroxylating ferredoxin subunit
MNDAGSGFIRVGTLDELRDRRRMVIGTPGGAVLVVADGDDVVALDNRCPHMGFPLHRGSIEDGILTCHWHHARFDLRSGSTFDLWADDVPLRDVRIIDGEVWVAAAPALRDEAAHWRRRLHDGLAHNISLVIGKAVLGATAAGVPPTEDWSDWIIEVTDEKGRRVVVLAIRHEWYTGSVSQYPGFQVFRFSTRLINSNVSSVTDSRYFHHLVMNLWNRLRDIE